MGTEISSYRISEHAQQEARNTQSDKKLSARILINLNAMKEYVGKSPKNNPKM